MPLVTRRSVTAAALTSAAVAAAVLVAPLPGSGGPAAVAASAALVERGTAWSVRTGPRPRAAWWHSARLGRLTDAPLVGKARWARTTFRIAPNDRAAQVVIRPHATGRVRVFLNGHRLGGVPLPRRLTARAVTGRNTVVVRLPRRGGRADPAVRALPPDPAPPPHPDPSPPRDLPVDPQPRALCRIDDPRLPEISGMATSVRHPGVVWMHNDSGDSARVFAYDTTTCRVRAVVRLAGVAAQDFEAVAMGRSPAGTPELWVGDVGDNVRSRAGVDLYRFPEPARLSDAEVSVTRVRVTWTDGPRDCESLLVDPVPGGALYLVSKQATGGVYRLTGNLRTGPLSTGRPLRTVGASASDAAIAPDRSSSVIRYYGVADLFPGVLQMPGVRRSLPAQPQGEAVAYSADSRYLYLASEGAADLMRIPVAAG